MSKRRINKQQSARIEKNQKEYHSAKHSSSEILTEGLVITRYSRHVEVEDPQGNRVRCSIRPNLDILVAGDKVIWQSEGLNQGVVVSIYPRKTVLARPTSRGLKKPVAANITQLVVVIAAKPTISWPLLDSYLIMAESLSLRAVILLNKTDLPCEDLKKELISNYQPLNYPIIMTNKKDSRSMEEFKSILDHQINVFIGQSGVGKSSLVSTLLPKEKNIAIQNISETTELGQHTTSNSKYYHLPSGGALIDSPGVREFSLGPIETNLIAQGYVEFKPYIAQCKYRNCTHINTPHCAIIEATNEGHISKRRYDNFLKLCQMHHR